MRQPKKTWTFLGPLCSKRYIEEFMHIHTFVCCFRTTAIHENCIECYKTVSYYWSHATPSATSNASVVSLLNRETLRIEIRTLAKCIKILLIFHLLLLLLFLLLLLSLLVLQTSTTSWDKWHQLTPLAEWLPPPPLDIASKRHSLMPQRVAGLYTYIP